MDGTYHVFYECQNCFYECVVNFPMGNMAENSLLCPNCETARLLKSKKGDMASDWYYYVAGKLKTEEVKP